MQGTGVFLRQTGISFSKEAQIFFPDEMMIKIGGILEVQKLNP